MKDNLHINQLNRELETVHEKQMKNHQDLQAIEHVKHEFSEVNIEARRLFERILEAWYCDEEIRLKLQQYHVEVKRHADIVTSELEHQLKTMTSEQQNLVRVEEDLYTKMMYHHREEKL